MAITKTITANGSKNHHKFTLKVNEDTTSGNSSFLSFTFNLSPLQMGWDWADWGDGISYTISIGDNNYNGTIPSYNGSSTVTLKSDDNIEILHNPDGTKTIDISFSVTDKTGANYTCGNASSQSTLTLSVLHKAPEITEVNVIENNTQLTSLGVTNNIIVQYLSNKMFTILATCDDATIAECSIYYNNILIGTSKTNEVNVNFDNVGELVTSGTNNVGLTVAVTDSKDGYSTRILNFEVIKYTRPIIEKTSTTIKRKTGSGTVLTDNKVLLNFVGTCYKGDDIIGNNNTPTIQYKIWNATEPNYNTLTTPNTAEVTVKDYEISNILYTSTYDYKIKITDTFTTAETTINLKIDKIPTGVSLWTEYKDRVDFLKLTIQNNDPFAYSTEERIIGTWLGKPLYSKVIQFNDTFTGSTILEKAHGIANVDTIWIDTSNSFLNNRDNGVTCPLPITYYGGTFTDRIGLQVSKEYIYIYTDTGWGESWTKIITLRYTKTTD